MIQSPILNVVIYNKGDNLIHYTIHTTSVPRVKCPGIDISWRCCIVELACSRTKVQKSCCQTAIVMVLFRVRRREFGLTKISPYMHISREQSEHVAPAYE